MEKKRECSKYKRRYDQDQPMREEEMVEKEEEIEEEDKGIGVGEKLA